MTQKLSRRQLSGLLQAENLEALSSQDLIDLFRSEAALEGHLPSGEVGRDPRTAERVLYAPSRARRPQRTDGDGAIVEGDEEDCPICSGGTTGVVDVAQLSEGFTFINKNLYPILYPFEDQRPARGMHFLQWTSSHHDRDWHNLPLEDCAIVMSRLAALEGKLVAQGSEALGHDGGQPLPVTIIKNAGGVVGASLHHGHQQIAAGGPSPGLIEANLRFSRAHGSTFAEHLLGSAGEELIVKDYGPARLLVAAFMKRPYEMFLVLEDPQKSYLHQLGKAEIEAIGRGWHDAARALHAVMPEIGRPVAYNVLTANGPGAGLYFEFLPYSQTLGGFEHIGLYICQGTPEESAAHLRRVLEG